MKFKKRVLFILSLVVIAFLTYNLFWYHVTYKKYDAYAANVEGIQMEARGSYIKWATKTNPYNYVVKFPGYLRYTGNLAINNNTEISLIIWPSIFSNQIKYGLRIETKKEAYEIETNEKGEPLESVYNHTEVESFNQVLKPYIKEIATLFAEAHHKWGV